MIAVRVYRSRYPTTGQSVVAILAAAMWGWSSAAIVLDGFTEANPAWSWMPFPWVVVIPGAAAVLWRLADEWPVATLCSLPWVGILAHDVWALLRQ